jgi:hypothetical protein
VSDGLKHRVLPLLLACGGVVGWSPASSAQLVVLSAFDPAGADNLCGLGYDPVEGTVWVAECLGTTLQQYAADGAFLGSFAYPGEIANDVDIEFTPEELVLGNTVLPEGTLLFINGETGPVDLYALDKTTGDVISTFTPGFGASHVVGGSYHPIRDTVFLLQDRAAGAGERNRIAEVDAVTGDTLHTFPTVWINFGDVDASGFTGHLFVLNGTDAGIAEYTPEGALVQTLTLPAGPGNLSGLGLHCARGEAWVSDSAGMVWRLGGVPCGGACPLAFNAASLTPSTVAPGGVLTVAVNVVNNGPGPRAARLDLDYARVGGGPSGTVTLGQRTVPETSGLPASVTVQVPASAPGGRYALTLGLVDAASGAICDTRPFTLTVEAPSAPGDLAGGPPVAGTRAHVGPFLAAAAATVEPEGMHVSPNPARGPATFRFTMERADHARLALYDALGREVAVLAEGTLDTGRHEVTLDASRLAPGVYVARLTAREAISARRLVVAR